MTPDLQIHLMRLGMAVLAGILAPVLGMRVLVPFLEKSPWRVTNHRGSDVPLGLGVVWVFWSLGILAVTAPAVAFEASEALSRFRDFGVPYMRFTASAFALMPATMILGVFCLGWIDDAWGSATSRGLSGHLSAARGGRVTTGAIKAVGITALAAFGAAQIVRMSESFPAGPPGSPWGTVGAWVLSAAAIALSANTVNLFDLRPGRALKAYSVLAVLALACVVAWPPGLSMWFPEARNDVFSGLATPAFVAVMLFGPLLAVWRSDVSERAMLGDAGANPAGALVGFVIAATAPLSVLGAYTLAILLLNLAAERVSFSAIIDGNRLLRRLDMLGRDRLTSAEEPKSPTTTAPDVADETPGFPDER